MTTRSEWSRRGPREGRGAASSCRPDFRFKPRIRLHAASNTSSLGGALSFTIKVSNGDLDGWRLHRDRGRFRQMFGGDGAVPSARLLFSLAHGDSLRARDRPNPTTGALTVARGARAATNHLASSWDGRIAAKPPWRAEPNGCFKPCSNRRGCRGPREAAHAHHDPGDEPIGG